MCDKNKLCLENIDSEYKMYINNFETYQKMFVRSASDEKTKKNIINTQICIKKMLCSGPILALINASDEYKSYALENKDKKNEDIDIFYQKKTEEYKGHEIVILGWSTKEDKEYWLIRDSNVSSFLKIGFSKIQNIVNKNCIGPDIIYNKKDNTFFTSTISIHPKLLDQDIKDKLLKSKKIISTYKTLESLPIPS